MNSNYIVNLKVKMTNEQNAINLNQLFDDLNNCQWENFKTGDKLYTDAQKINGCFTVVISHEQKFVYIVD